MSTPAEKEAAKLKFKDLTKAQLETKQKAALKEYGVEGNIPLNHEYWVIRNVLRAK